MKCLLHISEQLNQRKLHSQMTNAVSRPFGFLYHKPAKLTNIRVAGEIYLHHFTGSILHHSVPCFPEAPSG